MANIAAIVKELLQQRSRLDEAIRALGGLTTSNNRGRGAKGSRRNMSAAGRRRISLAQKARWAKAKGTAKPRLVRTMSQAARNRIAAAQRARWAKVHAKQQKKAA
jgi:hypothetical protein